MKKMWMLFGWLLLLPVCMQGQVAVKTNSLYDATGTVNLGMEIVMDSQWTFDLSGNYNAWSTSGEEKWKHWMLQPEARYWLCDPLAGHFFGVHAHGGQYNMGGFDGKLNLFGTDFGKLKDSRYEGWFVGAGIGYGYAWILDKHWNIEAEIGLGYSYTRFDRYPCADCGRKLNNNKVHHYVGPTKAALNLVYIF